MMLSSRADLEEERRLFYVAITRAQKKLFLSYALTRYRFGRLKNCEPSRFLDDIDQSFIKVSSKFAGLESVATKHPICQKHSSTASRRPSGPPQLPRTSGYRVPADFTPSDTSALQEGMKVEHPKFGFGLVTKMDSTGADRKAKINFDDFGEKTLLLNFAKLKIHA